MQTFFEQTSLVAIAFGVIFALCNCFFGYRLRKLWFALLGFSLGGLLGFFISTWLGQDAGIATLIGVVAGVVLALLSFKLYLCGVFLLCGGLFFMLWSVLLPSELSAVIYGMLVLGGVALSILIGIIAVKAVRPMVILTTAFSGGYTAVSGLFTLFNKEQGTLAMVLGIALGVAGLAFQFVSEKRRNAALEAAAAAKVPAAHEMYSYAPPANSASADCTAADPMPDPVPDSVPGSEPDSALPNEQV